MRVCHYSPVAPPHLGGIETFLTTLMSRLPQDKFLILTNTAPGSPVRQTSGNYEVVRYPPTPFGSFGPYHSLATRVLQLYGEGRRRRWLARHAKAFDVLHVHSIADIRHYGRITARFPWRAFKAIVHWYADFNQFHKPVLYTDHSLFIGSYERFLRACGSVILDHMEHVVCVDESGYRNARRYAEERGLSGDIWLLPNAVDTDVFRQHAPNDDNFLVGYVGRVEKEGLDLFLRLVRDARDLRFKACLAGDPALLPTDVEATPNLELVWNIPNNKMPSFYRSIGVLVDTFPPGVPRTSAEAMASGRPVVRFREQRDLESLLVSPDVSPFHSKLDMDGMIETLHRLRGDRRAYTSLCDKSRQTAEANFSASRIISQYREIYGTLSRS